MKLFGHELRGYAKWLVVLVAVLLTAIGLCGIQVAINGNRSDWLTSLLMIPGALEVAAAWLSAGGIVIIVIAWPATALWKIFKKRTSQTSKRGNPD